MLHLQVLLPQFESACVLVKVPLKSLPLKYTEACFEFMKIYTTIQATLERLELARMTLAQP